MLISYSWLASYLPKLPASSKLAKVLMQHGLDVESVTHSGDQFDRVVVGQIVGIRPHPNADKLRLAEVIIAPKGESQEIVCGAPNIAVGQKVPVALLGAKLPNGLTIESRAIRGVMSKGMLCARDELGLGDDHSGILVLDRRAKIGAPLASVLGADDVVFDVTTPANRADLMSMRGVAREVAAILKKTAKFAPLKLIESTALAKKSVSIQVDAPKLCPVYTARVIRDVKIIDSPVWLQNRLRLAGMRPINAVVDATNYIMLEYGQPLHAFDAATIAGTSLTVRFAQRGESLVTLDGKTRQLAPSVVVIADAHRPVALAGVMGGQATEVSTTTTDIFLESAIFDPVSIRNTSRHFGLVSEASKRFEKGLWPSLPVAASDAAAALITELCGGTVESGRVAVGQTGAPRPVIHLNPNYISERIGQKISIATGKAILTRLGFEVKSTKNEWTVSPPEWRPDIALADDIVDEVGRMIGYEGLPKELPSGKSEKKELPPMIRFKEEVKNILVDMGFTEVVSHAFYGIEKGKNDSGQHFEISNPLDKTQHLLRKSLLPQVLEVLQRQADAGRDALVFEIGRVFDPSRKGEIEHQQPWKVAIGVAQKSGGSMLIEQLSQKVLAELRAEMELSPAQSHEPIRGRTLACRELDLTELMAKSKKRFGPWDPERHVSRNVRYQEQSKYPSIKRDISFWWMDSADAKKMHEAISTATLSIQENEKIPFTYEIKDRFIKDTKVSYTLSFIFQSPDRTLTKAEVDDLEATIKAALKGLGATIRD